MSLDSVLHKNFLVLSIPETSNKDKRRLGRTAVGRNATYSIWHKILITYFSLEKRHLLRKMFCVYFTNSPLPQLLAKTRVYLVDSSSWELGRIPEGKNPWNGGCPLKNEVFRSSHSHKISKVIQLMHSFVNK